MKFWRLRQEIEIEDSNTMDASTTTAIKNCFRNSETRSKPITYELLHWIFCLNDNEILTLLAFTRFQLYPLPGFFYIPLHCITVTLEQSYNGGLQTLSLERWAVCDKCDGRACNVEGCFKKMHKLQRIRWCALNRECLSQKAETHDDDHRICQK